MNHDKKWETEGSMKPVDLDKIVWANKPAQEMNKSHLNITFGGILDLPVDVIVNAANEELQWGGGVCGIIFNSEGKEKLQDECNKIGHCDTGNAVYTPGFGKYHHIIHAVGPVYINGQYGEAEKLYNTYYNALRVAKEHDLHSIAFPLISAGIFGYPKRKAWEVGIKACQDFMKEDYPIDIYIINNNPDLVNMGKEILEEGEK